MAEKYLVNGISSNEISAQDRGLHYGDGLFETIAVVNKKLLCWDEHIKRLVKGCEKLNIPTPDKKVLENEALSLLDDKEKAVVKIIYIIIYNSPITNSPLFSISLTECILLTRPGELSISTFI